MHDAFCYCHWLQLIVCLTAFDDSQNNKVANTADHLQCQHYTIPSLIQSDNFFIKTKIIAVSNQRMAELIDAP